MLPADFSRLELEFPRRFPVRRGDSSGLINEQQWRQREPIGSVRIDPIVS